MSITLDQVRATRIGIPGRRRLAVGLVVIAVSASLTAEIFISQSGDAPRSGDVTAAAAFPGRLTDAEQAAIAASLGSRDPRQVRIARQVAAGEAGPSALADPATLRHHGIDTSHAPVSNDKAAERFHHR